jgi:hypothetical protein
MAEWTPIEVPYIAERFIGFSIPDHRHFLLISYEGVHEVVFDGELVVRSDGSLPEGRGVFDGRTIAYKGEVIPTVGLHGATAIITDESGHVLDLQPPYPPSSSNDGVVNVLKLDGEFVESLPFEDYSGDWQQATFSTDYRHIVIGTPYTVTIYRRI